MVVLRICSYWFANFDTLVNRSNLLHVFFQKRPNQRPEKRPRRDDEEAAVEDAAQEQEAGPMDVDQEHQQVAEEQGLIGE